MSLRLTGLGSNQDADDYRDQAVDRDREKETAMTKPIEQCQCTLRGQLVGDGCAICNPELVKELVQLTTSLDEVVAKLAFNLNQYCEQKGGFDTIDEVENLIKQACLKAIELDRKARQ